MPRKLSSLWKIKCNPRNYMSISLKRIACNNLGCPLLYTSPIKDIFKKVWDNLLCEYVLKIWDWWGLCSCLRYKILLYWDISTCLLHSLFFSETFITLVQWSFCFSFPEWSSPHLLTWRICLSSSVRNRR